MRIEKYSFGKMIINGQKYTSDLFIYENKIKSNWWRKQGHLLQYEDLNWLLNKSPNLIIIGTGNSGIMNVPNKLVRKLEKENINIIAKKTQKAVSIFNEKRKEKGIAAGFHLTC